MQLHPYTPTLLLKPFIKTFTIIESDSGMENFILPDTSLVLAIRYSGLVSTRENDGEQTLPSVVFSGIRKSPRVIKYSRKAATLLVIFKPSGAAAFFKEPLHVLFGQSLPVEYLHGYRDMQHVAECLAALPDNKQRIAFVEKILLSKLQHPKPDALTGQAIGEINVSHGNLHVGELAHRLFISQDAFEKRFRQTVGTSPKHFSSIVRLRSVIENYSPLVSLTELALNAGYYDQAHFNRDFKAFTLQTPRQFFSGASFW